MPFARNKIVSSTVNYYLLTAPVGQSKCLTANKSNSSVQCLLYQWRPWWPTCIPWNIAFCYFSPSQHITQKPLTRIGPV